MKLLLAILLAAQTTLAYGSDVSGGGGGGSVSITANRAAVSDGSGSITAATTTASEIGWVNGVTSAIQTQLNGKIADPGTVTDGQYVKWSGTGGATVATSSLVTETSSDKITIAHGTLASAGVGIAQTVTAPNTAGSWRGYDLIMSTTSGSNPTELIGMRSIVSANATSPYNVGFLSSLSVATAGQSYTQIGGTYGHLGYVTGSSSGGLNSGVLGYCTSANWNLGVIGLAESNTGASPKNVGVLGQAKYSANTAAGVFGALTTSLSGTLVPSVSAAGVFNNGDTTADVLIGQDNSSNVFKIADGGKGTIKAGGSASFVGFGGQLKVDTTAVGNVGAGEDDLISYSVPASTLGTNGDTLEFSAFGTFAANGNSKRVRCYFGATLLIDTGSIAVNNGSFEVVGSIIRTDATTQIATARATTSNALLVATSLYSTPAETLSGAVTLKCTGEATSDNDVSQKALAVRWLPNN